MTFFHETIEFLRDKNILELLYFFWYFILFDFFRYVVGDNVVLPIYLLKRYRQKTARRLARARLFHESPLVSVIAPGKNEGLHIPGLADSLRKQTYTNIELIIVDDGSDDDTPLVLRRLYAQGAIDAFFRNDVRGGKASAANLALRYAKGEFIVHLDADSHLQEDSIERILIPFFVDPEIGAVGGDIRVKNIDESLATMLQGIDYMKSISMGRVVSSTVGILRMISGAFGAFRKDVLDRLRGWDVGPGLDGDVTLKIRKLGFKIYHEPTAISYTNVPNTFRKLARQRIRWDRSLIRFRVRKHGDLLSLSHRHFRWRNFFTVFENLVFNLILNFKWWIYFTQIAFFHTEDLPVIMFINYLLYLFSNVIEYFLAAVLFGPSMRRQEYMLFFFLPLTPIYTGFYLRFVRTYAHLMEIFHKSSFEDKWNPWKVSKIAKKQKFRIS